MTTENPGVRAYRPLAAVLVVSAALAGAACGDDPANQAEIDAAVQQAEAIDRKQDKIDQFKEEKLEERIDDLKEQANGSGSSASQDGAVVAQADSNAPVAVSTIPAGAEDCGGAFAAGSASCEFTNNVAADYAGSGGASSFTSYSPVTGKVYTVSCSGSDPAVCTAGINAIIYIP